MAMHGDSSDQSLKLSATTCSEQSVIRSPRHPSIETRVCLIDKAAENQALIQALKKVQKMEVLVVDIVAQSLNGKKKYIHSIANMDIDIPYMSSKDGVEYANCDDPRYETIFVLEEFDGEIFDRLKHFDNRILGSPVVLHVASTNEPLPYTYRPQFCSLMQGLNLCFTNFKTKQHLTRLVGLCHYMGACIKKDMSAKIDFLVTNVLHGPKYRTAVSLGIPVMREDWVHMCWQARTRSGIHATNEEFVLPCKSKPFEGCTLSFLGFSEKECRHMQEQATQQGAKSSEVGDVSCTHLIVDEDNIKTLPFAPHEKLFVVLQEWFWGSIQIEARAAEAMYIFEVAEQRPMLTRSSTCSSLLGTPQKWRNSNGESNLSRASSSKNSFSRKRSRLREETLAKLAQDTNHDTSKQPPMKRVSTDTSTGINESLFDISNNTTAARSPRTNDMFKEKYKRKVKRVNPLAQKRFELKEFPSPILSTELEFEEAANSSPRVRGARKAYDEIKNKEEVAVNILNMSRITQVSENEASVRKSARLSRKRKSSNFEKDLSFVGYDQSFTDESFLGEGSAKKQKHSKERRRMSLGLGSLHFPAQACKFFRRLSSGSIFHEEESIFAGVEEHSTILEESENQSGLANSTALDVENDQKVDPIIPVSGINQCAESPNVTLCQDYRQESTNAAKAVSARYQVAMEFLQTEMNYVGILSTILNIFKKPLEDPKQTGGPILPSENVKAIFGSLPEINNVHTQMSSDLTIVMKNWMDSSCIGCIVQKYAKAFVRCYPPFVNFFEMSKDTIDTCESTLPRFHAFLKINQAKKECGRQTLAELLINPVQRLPRIILLLQDIKKHTERENASHPDVAGIQAALDAVKEVMTHINEDKRKTESQKQIFDIVYEVDGCPPTIVSSHRQFITRAELITVDDNLSSKGDHVCLFLFSDCVELAKRKRGIKSHSFKSPNVHSRASSAVRCLKHIKLMSLSHIKKVVNIKNSEDCQSAFSLFCRTPEDTQDWLYTFKMLSCTKEQDQQSNVTLGHDEGKTRLIELLARYRANTVCKTSDDNFIHTLASHELDVCTSDIGSTLGRAVRAAKKSHKKLARAFSFSRTPRRAVQRAVSSMMSPANKQTEIQSNESITPGLGTTPSRATPSRWYGSQCSMDCMDEQEGAPSSSGLTPSMSVSNLCTPQRDRRGNRLASTAISQTIENEENMFRGKQYGLKPSMSMMTLTRPEVHAGPAGIARVTKAEFQVPTPPVRRKRTVKTIKAATIALGRAGSFRRKNKMDSWL